MGGGEGEETRLHLSAGESTTSLMRMCKYRESETLDISNHDTDDLTVPKDKLSFDPALILEQKSDNDQLPYYHMHVDDSFSFRMLHLVE